MNSLMIRIDINTKEKLDAMKCIEVEAKKYRVNIKPGVKAYLTDGQYVFGSAIVKIILNKESVKIIILDSFKECKPYLLITDFNIRSNKQLKKMTLDVLAVTKRNVYEDKLVHFFEGSGLSCKSVKAYRLDIRQFLIYITDHKKNIHGKLIITDYQIHLQKMGLTESSIQRKMISVKRFLFFENLNDLDKQICIVNKSNKKLRILNLEGYEIV